MLPLVRNAATACFFLLTSLAGAQKLPATPGSGLQGQYYDGKNFEKLVLTRRDATLDFNWTIGPNGDHFVSPGAGVPGEFFSVRWKGHVYAPATGSYTFQTTADDGMRVWIGGRQVINSWHDQPVTVATGRVRLEAGRYYALRVEYYQADRDSRAMLTWQPPGATAPQPVPAALLYAALPPSARPVVKTPPRAEVRPVVAAKPVAPSVVSRPAAKPVTKVPPARAVRAGRREFVQVVPPASVAAAPAPEATVAGLSTLNKGEALTLPNLYFTQSTATLLPASRPTLNELARTLRNQPALRLEIAGHTDNVGEPALNLRLSEQRARVVRQYLVQQGIDSVRLLARGYGGTRPVADNRDPQQRPRNRRVEVVVQ